MASADAAGCYTVTWEIEHFDLLVSVEKGELNSPLCKMDTKQGSEWCLLRAVNLDSNVTFRQFKFKGGLAVFRCEMSLVSSCGEVRLEEFTKDSFSIEKRTIFGDKRQSILPNDTLTLCCRIWDNTINTGEIGIHSSLRRMDYIWKINKLPSSGTAFTFIEKDNFMLYLQLVAKNQKSYYTVIVREMSVKEDSLSFVDCNLSVKDGRGRVFDKIIDFPYNTCPSDIEIFHENYSNIELQMNYTIALHKCTSAQFEIPHTSKSAKTENISEEGTVYCCKLREDFLQMYREDLHSDASLKTEGKTFSVHKNILSARSPVFRSMFDKDEMKEGQSGVVDIDDIDSRTMDRMLVYLYSDSLDNVQWEEASALYYAADKYAVHALKQKCADILKASMTVSNAFEALVLADRHSDEELMKFTVDFIRDHKEIISSPKWEELEDINIRLTSKIMKEVFLKQSKN